MGFQLDGIIKKTIDSNLTVNSDYESERITVDNTEGPFSIQLNYNNGSTVDITWKLQGSVDGETFVDITDSDQQVVDPTGTILWDVDGTGLIWVKVAAVVATGSIDVQEILYSAKRRH